jgi:hypothetical protein
LVTFQNFEFLGYGTIGETSVGMHKMTRTSLAWIQPHPHGVKLRHILDTVNSFLSCSTNYLKNILLPNDLIIIRNHGDDMEMMRRTYVIPRTFWRAKEMHRPRQRSNLIWNSRV